MSRDLDAAAEGRQVTLSAPAPDQRPRGFGWRLLQILAGGGVLGSVLASMAIALSLEPFLLAMAAPFVIGLLLMLRWPRVGVIWLGVSSLGLLLFSAPFLAEALAHPESPADFIPLVIFTVSLLVGTVAAIPSFRQGTGPHAASGLPRAIAVGSGALIVAASVVAILAFVGTESVPAQAGDIRVVTEDIMFHPAEINAEGGEISVHVTNRDSTRHTFTIDELGVDLNVPPNSAQRVSVAAGPGTYQFYCRPHAPGMKGALVVS
jgi:plastocyanin